MKYKYRRIALSLSAENDKVISELAKLTGNPKTTIVNSLVIQAIPSFKTAIEALNKVKEGQHDIAVKAIMELVKDISGETIQASFDLGKMVGSDDRKK